MATLLHMAKQDGVLDQNGINSCWAMAVSSALSLMTRQSGKVIDPISALKYYEDCRVEARQFDQDAGVYAYIGKKVAMEKGFAPESMWAYDVGKLYTHAPPEVTQEATKYKVSSFTDINPHQTATNLAISVKTSLKEGKPVILAFKPQQYFFDSSGELSKQGNIGHNGYTGGHAVLVVGADDALQGGSYIVKNSWGTSWGDGGYGLISYKQFGTTKDLVGMYTINGFNGKDYTYSVARVEVNKIYSTVLQRPADISGLDWWAKLGASDATLANAFISSPEGNSLYGGLSSHQFVRVMYEKMLARVGDEGGVTFWTNILETGAGTRGDVALAFLNTGWNSTQEPYAAATLRNIADVANTVSIAYQYDGSKNSIVKYHMSNIGTGDTTAIKIGIHSALYGESSLWGAMHG